MSFQKPAAPALDFQAGAIFGAPPLGGGCNEAGIFIRSASPAPCQSDRRRGAGARDSGRALGYTEFFAFAENGSADGRSFCGSEGAGFPKQQGPVDQTPPPQLASTGGTARADVVNRGEPIRFLRPDPAANATSEQEPFSPVWADTEALSRQWVAHVTGRTRAARHTHPCEWRVARTVLISENAAVARNMVMAADSPSRNCFRQALGRLHARIRLMRQWRPAC